MHATRFTELGYRNEMPGLWRFVDTASGASVGRHYPTKEALLGDIDRYAHEIWGLGDAPASAEITAALSDISRQLMRIADTLEELRKHQS